MAKITFGQRVRAARQLNGMTIREAATAAGITEAYLSMLERDKRVTHRMSTLIAVASAVSEGTQRERLIAQAKQMVLSY
jgi:transcriptional regulator with XRE-family HTH domain